MSCREEKICAAYALHGKDACEQCKDREIDLANDEQHLEDLMKEDSITRPCHACNCALPALTGSTECCKHCANNDGSSTKSNMIMTSQGRILADTVFRPSWQETFFEIAKVVAKRSKDPHTKVGAVLVKDGHVLGIGYNGEPREFSYDFNWNSDEKYDFVIHAELNAIANACAIGANVVGADIYLTLSPCHECMKLLIQHKIKRVFYLEEYRDFEKTKLMAEHSNVELIKC